MDEKIDREKALIVFQPSGKRGYFAVGTTVLQAARQLGVYLESVCGGRGLCGRCQIRPTPGEFLKYGITSTEKDLSLPGDIERRYREKKDLPRDRRLGCSAVIKGDLVIEIPNDVQSNNAVIRKRAENKIIKRDLVTRLCLIELDEPNISAPEGDSDRLLTALENEWDYKDLTVDPTILPQVQSVLRAGNWKITAAVFKEKSKPAIVIGIWPGLKETIYGLSIDIGSTTIAAHICDLMTGRIISSAGMMNPQIRFGEDLMSRISYIQMNSGSECELTSAVRDAVNSLIDKTAKNASISTNDIVEAVIVGNPIMHHLFLGINPIELGGAPFALTISTAITCPAHDIISSLPRAARLHTLPCIAGHVGADASAVMLSERPYRNKKMTLLVDIGTNAEIILGNKNKIVAASSPTGPAFEGAEISCGQRAAPGAIERVRIDPSTYEAKFKIIGTEVWSDDPSFKEKSMYTGVTGICGSGIVEAIAELYLTKIISSDGVIQPPSEGTSNHILQSGRTFKYVIWQGDIEISILQTDVRAIQLAKAALYAGIRLLMDKLKIEKIEKIKLAGAFGSYIDSKYAMVLGLIPDCELKSVSSVGNAASTGARMALLNRDYRAEVQTQALKLEKVETAMEPRFQEHFVNAMAFPNKIEPFKLLRNQVTLPANNETHRPKRRKRGRPKI